MYQYIRQIYYQCINISEEAEQKDADKSKAGLIALAWLLFTGFPQAETTMRHIRQINWSRNTEIQKPEIQISEEPATKHCRKRQVHLATTKNIQWEKPHSGNDANFLRDKILWISWFSFSIGKYFSWKASWICVLLKILHLKSIVEFLFSKLSIFLEKRRWQRTYFAAECVWVRIENTPKHLKHKMGNQYICWPCLKIP